MEQQGQQWEYRKTAFDADAYDTARQDEAGHFVDMDVQGWELLTIFRDEDTVFYYWKRPARRSEA